MDIHHAMMVHNKPDRLYEALTQKRDLDVWMGAPTLARSEVGSTVEFQFDQGQRTLKMEVTHLEAGKQVQWRVIQPVWPMEAADQIITWTLTPYESSTLVDLRMQGWPQDDDVYASVSYKCYDAPENLYGRYQGNSDVSTRRFSVSGLSNWLTRMTRCGHNLTWNQTVRS